MANANPIINISKFALLMMLTPNNGKLDNNRGSTAQWIAQATEAAIPKAS
jgi:hypothetical protein